MGKKRELEAAQIYEQLVSRRTRFRSNGRNRTGSSLEITALSAVAAAVKGSIEAAELLLHMHDHSTRYGDFKAETKVVYMTAAHAAQRKAQDAKKVKKGKGQGGKKAKAEP